MGAWIVGARLVGVLDEGQEYDYPANAIEPGWLPIASPPLNMDALGLERADACEVHRAEMYAEPWFAADARNLRGATAAIAAERPGCAEMVEGRGAGRLYRGLVVGGGVGLLRVVGACVAGGAGF